jgi:hypothetical protein
MGTHSSLVLNAFRLLYPSVPPAGLRVLDIGAQDCIGMREDHEQLLLYACGGAWPAGRREALERKCVEWEERSKGLHPGAPLPSLREILAEAGATYHSVDLAAGATIRQDLNKDRVPRRLRNSFHFVLNFGTTEHIFNQWNCFSYIHEATRVGGAMVHLLPMQGYLFHCLFKYDPKIFYLIAEANGYDLLYAGFGEDEKRAYAADIFKTWANRSWIEGERCDSRLIEIVLRKTSDRRFQPPLDLAADSWRPRSGFPSNVPSIRPWIDSPSG